jgi:small subunit ribosomal protein S3
MGQKMNPLGFRLGVTQNHHSYWFAQPKNYSKLLRVDREMRNCIEIYVRKHISSSNYGGIARIEIKRKTDLIQVEIHMGFPALLVESRGRGIEQFKVDVRNLLHFGDRKLHMTLTEIPKPYGEPNILAEYIALQLESRVAFRRTMKKAIELAKKADIRGIKYKLRDVLMGLKLFV